KGRQHRLRPKSREETPKEGLRCKSAAFEVCAALHKQSSGRPVQILDNPKHQADIINELVPANRHSSLALMISWRARRPALSTPHSRPLRRQTPADHFNQRPHAGDMVRLATWD